jgi:hypothetical protein
MAAFDGRFFQRRLLSSKAAAFASEAMWVSLKSSHFFSTAAALAAFDGRFFNGCCFCQRRPLWPLLMAAFVNGGRFSNGGHFALKGGRF